MDNGHQHDLLCFLPLKWMVNKLHLFSKSNKKRLNFFLGTLDVWDILFKQNEPTLSIQVVDEPLHCLRVQEPSGRLVACGSQNGTVTLIEVSDNLCIQGKTEKVLVNGVSISKKFQMFFHIRLLRCLIVKHGERKF